MSVVILVGAATVSGRVLLGGFIKEPRGVKAVAVVIESKVYNWPETALTWLYLADIFITQKQCWISEGVVGGTKRGVSAVTNKGVEGYRGREMQTDPSSYKEQYGILRRRRNVQTSA
jgi:hypothetical protein